MTISEEILRAQLGRTLEETHFDGLGRLYQGKVRDNYSTTGGQRILVATDRLSAFDRVLGTIPFKGQVLNQLALHWFEETKGIAPNHVLSAPDPNVTIAHECEPLKAEFIMRGYMTGVTTTSIWYNYERGVRSFCGHVLPEGLRKNQRLERPLLTPTTKADKGEHDANASREELIARGLVSAADFDAAAAIAEKLFAYAQKRARERGLILVDTKYELGVTKAGELVVIDEIHTPDSSRYWYADDYEERFARGDEPRGLDKEYVRRWYVNEKGYRGEGPAPAMTDDVRVEAARRYIATYELVTGKTFVPEPGDPVARIAKALRIRS